VYSEQSQMHDPSSTSRGVIASAQLETSICTLTVLAERMTEETSTGVRRSQCATGYHGYCASRWGKESYREEQGKCAR